MSRDQHTEQRDVGQRRFIVQVFDTCTIEGERWIDVSVLEAPDAGTALQQVMNDPFHQLKATTYRVSEEALLVNVSINLEAVSKDG